MLDSGVILGDMDQCLVEVTHRIVSQRERLQLCKRWETSHIADIIVVEYEHFQVDKLLQLVDITVSRNKTNRVRRQGCGTYSIALKERSISTMVPPSVFDSSFDCPRLRKSFLRSRSLPFDD